MSDIISRLNLELEKRKSKNTRYSLRAFAKILEIDPSILSRILNKKIPLTQKQLLKISRSLKFTDDELDLYLNILLEERLQLKTSWGLESFFEEKELNKFKLVQEWQYLAILELIKLDGFEMSVSYISKKLNIPKTLAQDSIKNLKKFKIIKKNSGNKWDTTLDFKALLQRNLFAIAMRERQREILHKAAEDVVSLESELFEQCSFSMAIDTRLVKEAKVKIHNFKKKLAQDLHKKSKIKDNVYEFSVSLFPLTKG